MQPTEATWWRPTDGVTMTISHTASPYTGVVHWVTVIDRATAQSMTFLPAGVYWTGADSRVLLAGKPGVGEWEPVSAPGESFSDADFAELGKLLDDGLPPADNGEGMPA